MIRRYLYMGAALALTLGLADAGPSLAAEAPSDTITISGTIMVVPNEAPPEKGTPGGKTRGQGSGSRAPGHGNEVYVTTDSGTMLPISGRLVETAASGDRFSGTLRVPAALSAGGNDLASLERRSRAGDVTLPVATGTLNTSKPSASASSPMRHTVDVAFLSYNANKLASNTVIDARLNRLNTYWSDQSGGQISSIVRTQPIKKAVVTRSAVDICEYQDLWKAGARQFGKTADDYLTPNAGRHLLILVPDTDCDFPEDGGRGDLGDSVRDGGVMMARVDPSREKEWDAVVLHEFGHNISLMHSGARQCDPPTNDAKNPLTSTSKCEDGVYDDLYDIMGYGDGAALNATHRAQLRSIPSSDLISVTEAGGSNQTFTIKPAAATSGLRGLAITDPLTGEKIYAEYRYPTGIDSQASYVTDADLLGTGPGVRFLRALSRTGNPSSTALGRWHAGNYEFENKSLLWWRTWDTMVTYNNAVSVQVRSQSSSGATVRVSFRVTPKTFTTVPTPGIKTSPSGQPGWGSALKPTGAAASDFAPRPDYVLYQWRRDGVPILYGETPIYYVTPDDLGHTLQVRAVAYRSGYKTVSRTSAPVTVRNLNVTRLAGANRYETAVKISQAAYPPPAKTTTVYLATGAKFADALAAAPAAAKEKAPLLLVPSTGAVPEAVKDRIASLEPSRIIVVGGTSSVSDAVVAQVRALRPAATIQRIAGPDRYATSRAVVGHAFAGSTPAHVYVATGRTFPDALAASGAAGANGEPVILVDGKASNLNADTTNLINTLRPSRAYVTGGYGTVSGGIQNALKASYPTTRLSGPDRYATAVAINEAAFPGTSVPNHQWATGSDFPDALAGATLAAAKRGPLYLVKRDCVPDEVRYEATRTRAAAITLLGGTSTLGSPVQRLDVCFRGEGD